MMALALAPAPAQISCDFIHNALCFMFFCNGQVIQQQSIDPPDCDVMGDGPKTWSDARLHCRRMGGTISSKLQGKAQLLRGKGVMGDLWSSYFVQDGRMMEDTAFTPVQASMDLSLWKLTEPVTAGEHQCVSFTRAGVDCYHQNPSSLNVLLKTKCQSGYQFHMTSCQRSLDFMCQIPARRLKSIRSLPSRSVFIIENDMGSPEKHLLLSSFKATAADCDSICRKENSSSKIFTLNTQADHGMLRFFTREIRQHVKSGELDEPLWVKDAHRPGCFALSLLASNTSAHVIRVPCQAKLRILCAYDIELPAPQAPPAPTAPQMSVVTTYDVARQEGKEIFLSSKLIIQTLGTFQHHPQFRLGCRAHLTSPNEVATIYRNGEAIATFQGGLTRNQSVYYLDEQSAAKNPPLSETEVVDLVGYYYCEMNDVKNGIVISSEKLFVRPNDVDVFSVHFELPTPIDDQLWSVFTLKCLLNTHDAEGLRPNAARMLAFNYIKQIGLSAGYATKPLILRDRTLVTYAAKRLSDKQRNLLKDETRTMEAIRELASFVNQHVDARLHGVTRVVIRSLDWCLAEQRLDNQTKQINHLPVGTLGSSYTIQSCHTGGAHLITVDCVGDKIQGLSWGHSNIHPNCQGIDYTSSTGQTKAVTQKNTTLTGVGQARRNFHPDVNIHSWDSLVESGYGETARNVSSIYDAQATVRSLDPGRQKRDSDSGTWCRPLVNHTVISVGTIQVPRTKVGAVWSSSQLCPNDGVTPVLSLTCIERNGRSEWKSEPFPPTCFSGFREIMGNSTTKLPTTQSPVRQTTQPGVTEAIREAKNLLTQKENVTATDMSHIADILQRIGSGQQKLAPSDVQGALDVISEFSALPEDTQSKNRQTRASSSNRILNATNNLGVVLHFGEGETDMRFVSGGLALEVWDISNQSLGSTPVIGIKSLVNEDNEDLELVTQFAENEINYNDTEAAIYLPQNILKNFTSNENNSVRLVLNVYKDTRLYKQATGQDVNQIDGALNSRVVAAQLLVNGEQVTDFRGHKVLTVFEPTRSIEFGEERKYKSTCAYWNYSANYGLGAWSTTGCELNKTVEGRVVCQWNHLTNFAIYLSFREQSQLEHREILGIITKIGLSLSIIGIVGFMLSFLCIRKLRARLMWKVMFQLSLALLLSSIVFLTGIEQTSDYGSCIAVAVILHYLVLVSFMCMLVDAILQYLMFVKRMNKEQILSYGNFWWKTALPCWGLPVIPVIIILAIDHHLYRGGTHYCWLKLQAFYWGFALPLTLILLTNFIIFVRVSMKMCCREDMTASSTRKDNQILVNIRMSIFCFTMLGLTWVFGFFAIEDARLGFQYLFSITSSLQGFIMFVLTTARDAKIRKYWIEKVSSCLHLKQEVVLPSSITGTAGRKRKMFTGTPTTRATNTTFADRTPKTSNTSMSVINGASSGLHGSHPWVRTPKTSNTSMSVMNGVSSGSCSSNPLVRTPAQVHEHGGDQIHTAGTHSG